MTTDDATIHALKVTGQAKAVYDSLHAGEGRFGWSYVETADLRSLSARIAEAGLKSLTPQERECYQGFLLELRAGDWVVYINTPHWGRCTAARVTGEYQWRWEDRDFNHRFQVDPASVVEFDRNDALVHPALSARLKLQGRHWKISTRPEFFELMEALRHGQGGVPATHDDCLKHLAKEVRPALLEITKRIHHTHPNTKLEALFVRIFQNLPGVIDVKHQGGAGDHGADILVTIERPHPITRRSDQSVCVVQVKSYAGEHADLGAVEDIRRAFEKHPEATFGLIVSTATSVSLEFETKLDQLRNDTGKDVSLLVGEDIALFALEHAPDLFTTHS